MGLLDKILGAPKASQSGEPKQEADLAWIQLATIDQLEEIVERSKTKAQFIFKHSTRCGVSRMVIGQFKKRYQLSEGEADLYYLDLLAFRPVCNAIAEKFQVIHESPQLLVIKNGAVVAHESHSAINRMELEQFV